MSMVLTFINPSAPDRIFYTHLFGSLVQKRRRYLGLTVTRAAELTGMTESEWLGVEAGFVPPDHRTIHAIAATLEVRKTELVAASILSRLAQDETVQ